MFDGVGRAVDAVMGLLYISILVAWPLALWKLVEIVIWVWDHLEVSWK